MEHSYDWGQDIILVSEQFWTMFLVVYFQE